MMGLSKTTKKHQGSVLVFTLIILTILLVSALAVVTVSIAEKRSSFSTQKSVTAFQAADSAAERVLKVIYQDYSPPLPSVPINTLLKIQDTVNGDNLEDVANRLFEGNASCSGDEITGSNTGNPAYQFKITFYDQDGDEIACDNYFWRDEGVRIVAEGFFRNTSRVIEVGIRPREDKSCKDDTGAPITVPDGSVTYNTIKIGDQCWMLQNMRTGAGGVCYTGSSCTSNHPNQPDGELYTWAEAMVGGAPKGICPIGWHIPSDEDWYDLENFLDNGQSCSDSRNGPVQEWGCVPAGEKMKPFGSSGFEGNFSGYRTLLGFSGRGTTAQFMSSSDTGINVWGREIQINEPGVKRDRFPKIRAISVRCIQD